MAAIPAPEPFTDLRQHLRGAGIDPSHLAKTLDSWLSKDENLPQVEWFTDPLDDHQAWDYRQRISDVAEMLDENELAEKLDKLKETDLPGEDES